MIKTMLESRAREGTKAANLLQKKATGADGAAVLGASVSRRASKKVSNQ